MQKRTSIIRRIFFFLNIIAAACLLISYCAIFTDPALFWPVAFFGLAYPFLIIVNLIFLVFWMLKMSRNILISGIVILAGLNIHRNVFNMSFREEPEKTETDVLKIMSYNVHEFRSISEGHTQAVKSQMLHIIQKEQPSLMCFQEFYTRSRGKFAILDSIKRFTPAKNVFYEVISENDIETIGMAIFSKYPIVNTQYISFGDNTTNSCIYADIIYRGDTIRVFNVHLQSIKFQPEDYQYFKMLKEQINPDIESSRKIGSKLKRAFIRRSDHARIVRGEIDKSPYKVIVCGDFNDNPVSYSYYTIAKGLKNAFSEKGTGYGITYGGAFPHMQIDYILSDPSFYVLDYKVIRKNLSDHYPVVSRIVYRGNKQ